MRDFTSFARDVTRWQDVTFPDATAESCAKHLLSEAQELLESIQTDAPIQDIANELGDVVLLAIAVAHKYDIPLQMATESKFAVAANRDYIYDPELGFSVHVK